MSDDNIVPFRELGHHGPKDRDRLPEPIDLRPNGPRIFSQATAESLRPGLWEITVHGGLAINYGSPSWPTHRRVYTIESRTDDQAAFQALAQFEAEIENLVDIA